MSIKLKLSIITTLIIGVILTLNITYTYISSLSSAKTSAEQQMNTIAKQIITTIEILEENKVSMELVLGEKLRIAAIAIQERLDPDLANISNTDLETLRTELGLSDITLWQRKNGVILSQKSSNKDELNLNATTWDYWHTAFQQLFDGIPVTVTNGQTSDHYWSGPINIATSNPAQINKWGYYYDGSTNFMINPIITLNTDSWFNLTTATNDMIANLQSQQPDLLEITGFNPAFFRMKSIIKLKNGIPVYHLDTRDIAFGSYDFKDTANDAVLIQRVLQSGEPESMRFESNGSQVIRHFVPVSKDQPYVVGVAFDEQALLAPVHRQLWIQISFSLLLLLFTLGASYIFIGYRIRTLTPNVDRINF